MKKYLFFAILALVFASCRTDVDLYIDKGDTTMIYSILDVTADTNFFKISKSSLHGDYYYEEDDIDVYFTGLFDNETIVDTVMLHPVTKKKDGQLQSLYFTTKKLSEGQDYELFVIRHDDGVKVSAKTKTICHIFINKPNPLYPYIDFKYNSPRTIEWTGPEAANFQINAAYFEVSGLFHYKELMPGSQDTVNRSMEWYFGGDQANLLFNAAQNHYVINYTPCVFFHILETDTYLLNNSPEGVQRWLQDFEFRIAVTGEDIYYYNISNGEGNHYPETNTYTNVENGRGILSSFSYISTFRTIEQVCRIRIAYDYPYGFIYDPNR